MVHRDSPSHPTRGGPAILAPTSKTDRLIQALAGFDQIRLAIVFGSVGRGDANDSSDLDLAVLCEFPLTSESKAAMISALGRATGRPIDLIDLGRVGEPLLGEILKSGRRIIVRETSRAR